MKTTAFKLKTALLVFVVAGLIAATFSLVGLRTQIMNIGGGSESGPLWYVSAMERDVAELQLSVANFRLGFGQVEEVIQRFDILWSRVSGATEGEVAQKLVEYGVDTRVIGYLQSTLQQYENTVMNIETVAPETIQRLIADFDIMNNIVHRLSLEVLQASSAEARSWREALLDISFYNVVIGGVIGVAVLVLISLIRFDLTSARRELVEKEELLVAAEAANLAKSQFIATVNHELRTPLTSINGTMSLMNSGAFGPLPEKLKKPIDIAVRNCKQLSTLISDLLDVEKISSGNMDFHTKKLDLSSFLQDQVESIRPYVESFEIKLELEPEVPQLSVNADEQRLGQVLSNLISNAAKFSNPGGKVIVGLSQLNDRAVVSVQDTGRGIPEEARDRLFERFQQVDSSDSRERGGTGLGLSIVKSIIESHNGTISYESTVGKGTTFYFDLSIVP